MQTIQASLAFYTSFCPCPVNIRQYVYNIGGVPNVTFAQILILIKLYLTLSRQYITLSLLPITNVSMRFSNGTVVKNVIFVAISWIQRQECLRICFRSLFFLVKLNVWVAKDKAWRLRLTFSHNKDLKKGVYTYILTTWAGVMMTAITN